MTPTPQADESLDVMLRGHIQLLQAKKGYRTSVDAMLLGWFASKQAGAAQLIADFGAGSGLVSIILGRLAPDAELNLIERQTSLAERATRNLRLNGVRGLVRLHDLAHGAVPDLSDLDLVVSNPPYYRRAGRNLPSHPERRDAHYESTAGVETFSEAAAAALGPSGVLCMVYPAEGAERLVRAFAGAGLGNMRMQPLHHRSTTKPAIRVLLAGRRGPLDIIALPRLAIHAPDVPDHTYSLEIEAFLERLRRPAAR